VDDRVLLLRVAFGALARGTDEICGGLIGLDTGRFSRNALTIKPNAMTTAMNTGLNDTASIVPNAVIWSRPEGRVRVCKTRQTSLARRSTVSGFGDL